MPSHLGMFVLSYSKRIKSKFVHEIYGFYSNKIHYQDTDCLFNHMDHYEKLKKTGYIGNNLGQRKKEYGDGGSFYGLFLALNLKLSYTIGKYGTL